MKNVIEIIKGINKIAEGLNLIKGQLEEISIDSKAVATEKEVKKNKTSKVEKDVAVEESKSKVEETEEAGEDNRRAELEEMSYNDLKALVSKLGGKAVGKKPALIEQILELEDDLGDEEVSEEEVEGLEDELDTDKMRAQLEEFELDELKDIAKHMGLSFKAKGTKKSLIELVLGDLAKLDEALEALGYYVEDEEEEIEEEEPNEEEQSIAEALSELGQSELADICSEYGLSVNGKKQTLIDRIVEAVENGDIEESDLFTDEEEGEEETGAEEEGTEEAEEVTVEELVEELELSDLKDVAKELGMTIKKNDKRSAILKAIMAKDEDEIYNALVELGLADGEEADSEDDGAEEVEVSEEVTKAEEKVEKDIRAKVKSKKLTDATIKKFLSKYYEGDPDCADCSGCSKEERLDCYIKIQRNLVDDDGELNELNSYYERGEVGHCCGKPVVELDNGNLSCEICGEEYTIED